MLTTDSDSMPFRVEKTTHLTIGDASFNSGCSVMEVAFPAHISCKVISTIHFDMGYSSSLPLKMKLILATCLFA